MPRRLIRLDDESGILMPFVVGFLIILTTIGATLAQTSTQTFNNSLNFSYNQIAHVASKAAIDYGEEAYELNAAYSGTPEQDLHNTDRYRSTIEVEVLYNQGSSAKRIRAIGRVYVFEPNNGTADFTREIQASIIRNGAVAGNPADYEPILWLDAGAASSLFSSSSSSPGSEVVDGLFGSSYDDITEERGTDAGSSPGSLGFNSSDLELAYGGSSTGHQTIGLRFRNVNVAQGEAIDSAYIQFTTDETKQSGSVELLVEAVDSDNPSPWSGTYGVSNSAKIAQTVTWNPPDWNNVGLSGADERVDITPLVQALVNRSGWSDGNAMAFSISYVSGGGIRTAEAGSSSNPAPQLQINWSGGGSGSGEAVNDGDPVGQWLDISGESNDAIRAYGVDGVLKKAQINGHDAVRFSNNTALRSALSPTVSGDGITAFVVMKPAAATAASGRFLTAQNTARTNDYGTADSAILFLRYGTGSTLAHYYDDTYGPTLTGAVDDTWSVYSSRITDLYSERLLENGADNLSNLITNVDYDLNEIFIGGARSGSTGTNFSQMDLAELIVYDDALVCSEMQQVENYLGLKYNITITDKSCP